MAAGPIDSKPRHGDVSDDVFVLSPARGFTMIELLVVVTIIALLISLLLPSLGRAKEAARTVGCGTQQRQIGLASHAYANANRGYLPLQIANYIGWLPGATKIQYNTYLGGGCSVFYCPTLSPVGKPLEPYLGAAIANQSAQWFWDNWLLDRYNSGLHYIGYVYLADPMWPQALASGQHPSNYWVDVDADGTTRDEYVNVLTDAHLSNTAILIDQVSQGQPSTWVFRHPADSPDGSTNVLLGDAHVENRTKSEVKIRWYLPNPIGW